VRHDLHILDGLEPLIKEVEAELVRQSSLEPWAEQAAFLVQVPGIGVHNAVLLLAAIGDIRRFDAAPKRGGLRRAGCQRA
jgi:transposase